MSLTVEQLADQLGVEHQGQADTLIEGVATLERAQGQDLTFLANPTYKPALARTQAGAVILSPNDAKDCPVACLISTNPYATWARALELLHPTSQTSGGIHPTAVIDASAQIDPTATIGAYCVIGPQCVIGPHATVGAHVVVEHNVNIGAHAQLVSQIFIGAQCQIGDRVIIHPGVVIGADGFGLALDEGHWRKVLQLGCVIIGNDSEVGANTTIDRGAIEDTVIGQDVRIDNQVQIAHNVRIGDHTAIAGCVGIAGSTTIGAYCMIAGASGIGGHLTITDRVVITAMSTVVSSITEPGTYGSGIPAQPHQRWKRILVRLAQLDQWVSRIKGLEKG